MNDRYKSLAQGVISILLVTLALLLISISLSGCRIQRTAVNTATLTDTVTILKDSLIVRDRIVPIEVQLPGSTQYVEVNISHDTTSVLEDGLYRSTATVRGGKLMHSLATKKGASLKAQAHVQDTLRTSHHDTASSTSRTVYKTKIEEVNKLHWWQKLLMYVGAMALAGVVIKLYIRYR